MKLDVAVNEVVLSNVGTTGEFKIRNSAKAFKILSDGLYSNKIRAIIRELSCNALDSHVAAGKKHTPFEVHLPSVFEPWFSVRDFGTGLSGEQVVNIYTTYFESTKTDSNDFIGALGLGSKSPFSYTENFTVIAIKDGTKRIYSAFINEMGVPSIAEMSADPSTDANGVEVKFSVTDRYDYQSFRNEAQSVFKWFKDAPTVTGNSDYRHETLEYEDRDIIPGVHLNKQGYNRTGSVALMGNIAYPLNNIPEAGKHLGDLAELLNCGLTIEFDIGELDFAASREYLSFIPLTLNSIRAKLELLNASLASHVALKFNECTNEWQKSYLIREKYQSGLYRAAVLKYVADTKFALFDSHRNHSGLKTFELSVADMEKRNLTFTMFSSSYGSSSKLSFGSKWVNQTNVEVVEIPVLPEVIIVLNDLNIGCTARARYHFCNHNGNKHVTVFCVTHTDRDAAVKELEYNKLLTELHNPPTVMKASELQKRPRDKPMSTQGIMHISLKSGKSEGCRDSYTWSPVFDEIDDTTTYHFVYLSNTTPLTAEGEYIDVFDIKAKMDSSGIDELKNIEIIGVRKNRIDELKDLDNWVWFEEAIRTATKNINNNHVASLIATEELDSYYKKVYTNQRVADIAGPDSPYAKYVNKYLNIKRSTGNAGSLVSLCSKYGNVLHVDAVTLEINNAKVALYARYPMLKVLAQTPSEIIVADYIKLVDKQEKI